MGGCNIPDSSMPDIAGSFLLEKGADLLDLTPARGGIVQQVAELAGIRLHIDGALGRPRIALEDENLVFRTAFLADGMHG